jgi:hypothetical protein
MQEIKEQDNTISEKEKRIYDLKKKNQELEKFKFVLDHKIKELKKQIQPKEEEIADMKDQIKERAFSAYVQYFMWAPARHLGSHAIPWCCKRLMFLPCRRWTRSLSDITRPMQLSTSTSLTFGVHPFTISPHSIQTGLD